MNNFPSFYQSFKHENCLGGFRYGTGEREIDRKIDFWFIKSLLLYIMWFLHELFLYKIIELVESYEYEIFLVGGFVRDMIIGKENKVFDLCTNMLLIS